MIKTKVYMEEIKETEGKEFIIRDEARITIGRFTIVERNSANKSIMIRLRFYREGDRSLLRESLGAMTRGFLRDGSFFKVNVIVSDDISTVPFTELGYTLEGILVNNSYQDSRIRNEYLFGTDNTRFNQFKEFKLLALDGGKGKPEACVSRECGGLSDLLYGKQRISEGSGASQRCGVLYPYGTEKGTG